MTLTAILLGLINIGIVALILVLVGALAVWIASLLGWAIPWNVQRIYLAIVALVALYMLVALLVGIPTLRIVGTT